jgi:Kef-type K+ transport system membrane component KefB
MDLALVPATVVTLCVSVTALPVALHILSGFGRLNTRVARVAISSAPASDVLMLLALGVVIAMATSQREAGLLGTVSLAVKELGVVAEWLGFHFVIGVFLAALMVTRGSLGDWVLLGG